MATHIKCHNSSNFLLLLLIWLLIHFCLKWFQERFAIIEPLFLAWRISMLCVCSELKSYLLRVRIQRGVTKSSLRILHHDSEGNWILSDKDLYKFITDAHEPRKTQLQFQAGSLVVAIIIRYMCSSYWISITIPQPVRPIHCSFRALVVRTCIM